MKHTGRRARTKAPPTSVPHRLAELPDPQFFREISTGLGHLAKSLDNLDRGGEELYRLGNGQSSEVLRFFAQEEAGKALILLDAVRCPRTRQTERCRTLRGFRSHLAKGIYAEAVDWRYATFKELRGYVQMSRKSLYLDGPLDVDWIFPNEIETRREGIVYVDYKQDITETQGERVWAAPRGEDPGSFRYVSAEATNLVRSIVEIGLSSPEGLAIVAEVWRGFEPEDRTRWDQVGAKNMETLERLRATGACRSRASDSPRRFVNHWIPPMWSLEMTEDCVDIKELREIRRETSV